uniref:Uncharacterized protein n=1 Tax=Paramoeba pemaquidensis TaxID=180228 RepID=A0A1D8DB88_9EUKA|nr:hypothetical protein [Paramoeba pemaquidensis]AOS85551.1 hypothetical protein [Paramoeba pemaquidensis]
MVLFTKIINYITNLIDLIRNDETILNYILISFCFLLLVNLNIVYKKINKKEKYSVVYLLKLNITIFISIMLMLYCCDILYRSDIMGIGCDALKSLRREGYDSEDVFTFKLFWIIIIIILFFLI